MTDSKTIDPENLNIQCVLDKVFITLDEENTTKPVGTGHLTFFIDDSPDDKEVLVVRFNDDEDNEKATIVLLSTSTAWLENEKTIVFPRPNKGGLWKIDCSQSEEDSFKELQDILTFFIVFENRHNMRNMLVMVDPESCEVKEIVTKDVHLESMDSSGNLKDEGEFATSEDEKLGEKLPVYLEDPVIDEGTEVPKSRRVRILNRSANALLSGSTWLSNTIVQGGDTVARHISSGGSKIEERIEPSGKQIKISDGKKEVFQTAYNTSTAAKVTANGLVDRAASMTVSGVSTVSGKKKPEENEVKKEKRQSATLQLGKSALLATARVLGSVFKAKRAILKSSRESVVQVVQKKYGDDASLVVDKTICTGYNISCMMVYFDAQGVARRVVQRSAVQSMSGKNKKQGAEAESEAGTQEEKIDKE